MKIAFVSLMGGVPWGGSEELWYQTATRLHAEGHEISVCVQHWPERPAAIQRLLRAGIPVIERRRGRPDLWKRALHRIRGGFSPDRGHLDLVAWLEVRRPDLICVSNGVCIDDLESLEIVAASGRPWCNVAQCGVEWCWPVDPEVDRVRKLVARAECWFFVSEANRRLFELQWAVSPARSAVVHNPRKLAGLAAPPWPSTEGGYRLACVARLDPVAKGQDILLLALSREKWRGRALAVSLFGGGERTRGLEHLISQNGLEQQVRLCGHVDSIEAIWTEHHALVLPSRHEGLPLALVEAMLCGRPAIVTDVGGNAELVSEGRTGFIASAPTVAEMDGALERAWANRDKWESLGHDARLAAQAYAPEDPVDDFARRLLALVRKPA